MREIVPEAEESISYGIPTFKQNGNLVHFGAYPHHIGFYPGSSGIEVFRDRLSHYVLSKGTVQLPLDEPIPFDLVREIVMFRAVENAQRAKGKK